MTLGKIDFKTNSPTSKAFMVTASSGGGTAGDDGYSKASRVFNQSVQHCQASQELNVKAAVQSETKVHHASCLLEHLRKTHVTYCIFLQNLTNCTNSAQYSLTNAEKVQTVPFKKMKPKGFLRPETDVKVENVLKILIQNKNSCWSCRLQKGSDGFTLLQIHLSFNIRDEMQHFFLLSQTRFIALHYSSKCQCPHL